MKHCESCNGPTHGKLCDPCFEQQTVTPEGHTVAQLREAFDSVAHPDDWKISICCAVAEDVDQDLIGRAIIYFTGSVATFQPCPGGIQVQAPGYCATVGT